MTYPLCILILTFPHQRQGMVLYDIILIPLGDKIIYLWDDATLFYFEKLHKRMVTG
jgi:hypothetical protein